MSQQDSRLLIKRTSTSGVIPTVPSSSDHTDGTWIATDIYKGELFWNQADHCLWTRGDNGVECLGGYAKLTIASADVLTLNATPLTIVPAVAGKAIEVVSASVSVDFNTTAYATNTSVALICNGATAIQYRINACLNANTSSHRVGEQSTATVASDTQLIVNADLQVVVTGGNPTAGDSDITVYVHYRYI